MGNTHSMNNMTLLDQKRYQAEFLRYSQIPYESQFHQQQQSIHASNMNLHQFNKYKEQHALANPIKVLPDVRAEPKALRTTNNGAILHSGGTISGRKDSDCGLHRSKSISETQNTYLSNPHGMPTPPPQFRMQRASTQLSINLQQPMRANLNKNYGSSHDLNKSAENKSAEKRLEKHREAKKGRAPPPPASSNQNSRIKMTPPPQMQAPDPPTSKSKSKPSMGQRLFGDTLTKNHQNAVRNVQAQPERVIKSKETSKPALSKVISAPAKAAPSPFSYLRRERTFDMTLMQPENKEKFRPKFSPQFQRKKYNEPIRPAETRQMSTSERYRASVIANRASAGAALQSVSELQSTAKVRQSMAVTNSEKMKTIDKRPLKKQPAPAPAPEKIPAKAPLEQKKSSDHSAISNPTVSASSSFKYSKPKEPEIIQFHRHGEEIIAPRERDSQPKEDIQQQMNNFYFGMKEASVDTDNDDDDENENEADQAQMEAINRFAEDIFKMSGGGYMPNSQVSTESIISDRECDSDSSDILLNLRPTLPRRQLQIPRFSPVAAWKSLLVDSNLSDVKNGKMSSSMLQLHMQAAEEARQETKIERIYREPSFNLQQLDNKSGDSGISADKEIGGNSPDGQMPQAYMMSSWTPQQDLEEDEEESIDGNDKESYQAPDADQGQSFVSATNGHMFSLSLPRDNPSVSDKAPQNNFYSLQKFRKTVADVFGSITNVNDNKIQIQNYGVDSNWLLSSQPNSIDQLSPRNEGNQIISQMTSGKHVMYLPTNFDDKPLAPQPTNDYEPDLSPTYKYEDEPPMRAEKKSKSKSHKFKFQSTIRQVERRKIAEKLSREAEEKEMHRLSELEAMQKVEEEFQRKRAREKNMIRQQLRIATLEENYDSQNHFEDRRRSNNYSSKSYDHIDDEVDTRTPYISRIIEAKSPKITTSQYKS